MGQDQGEFLAIGPAGPALGGVAGALVDGPEVGVPSPLAQDDLAAELDLDSTGNQGFKSVIKGIKEHKELVSRRGRRGRREELVGLNFYEHQK